MILSRLRNRFFLSHACVWGLLLLPTGCRTPASWRRQADAAAYRAIGRTRAETFGEAAPFTIEGPSDSFRRRLLSTQNLAQSDPAFLGLDSLPVVDHWPDDAYLREALQERPSTRGVAETGEPSNSPVLSLFDALQIAAHNSRDYQSRKEGLFLVALALDLEADAFRNTFAGMLRGEISTDLGGGETVSGLVVDADVGVSRRLLGGSRLAASLSVDLVKLLTQNRASALGLRADAGIAIPLGRGAGRHIVRESLTQAEFDLLYAVWEFERFKQGFAVQVAAAYYQVLVQRDQVDNAADNYRRLQDSAARTRQLAGAGRLPEIQADQAAQDELRARNRWVSARQSYARQLDGFKSTLGLPPDAALELDGSELETIAELVRTRLPEAFAILAETEAQIDFSRPVAPGPLELVEVPALGRLHMVKT